MAGRTTGPELCPGAWGRDAGTTNSGRGHGGQQVCLDYSVHLEFSRWGTGQLSPCMLNLSMGCPERQTIRTTKAKHTLWKMGAC